MDKQNTNSESLTTKGKIYLIPTTLGGENVDNIAVPFIKDIVNHIDHYAVENVKHARRYLRKLDIQKNIGELSFFELNKRADLTDLPVFIDQALEGKNIGVISDAGCPGIADPGAEVVAIAHRKNIQVVPISGPSSIFLALMGSGFNGQEFTFHGYLPKEQKDRISKIREFEKNVIKSGQTQIFMDTPYRNSHVYSDILAKCRPDTMLCIACNLTTNTEMIKTMPVFKWRKQKPNLHKRPALFLLGV